VRRAVDVARGPEAATPRTLPVEPAGPTTPELPPLANGALGFVERLGEDVDAALQHDPAARSRLEVALLYPGVHAIWMHRFAHALWTHGRPLVARVVSQVNRFVTGIEIHPGARIGRRVFMDHGMGIVIGETAAVGDGCLLYKGVVLGGVSLERKIRHPQLGRNVVVGSNACVLGAIEIGEGARIGSGSVVIKAVPPGATVVGIPGRVVTPDASRAHLEATLDHGDLPDPVADMIRGLAERNDELEQRIQKLEGAVKRGMGEDVE